MAKPKIIEKKKIKYGDKEVVLTKLANSEKKRGRNGRVLHINCPNCLSKLEKDDSGVLICSGNKLKIWETEFKKFYVLSEDKKTTYKKKLSDLDRFEELYSQWYTALHDSGRTFECGYTNKIYYPISVTKSYLPDPVVTKQLEAKLGRKLTEAECLGESELWEHKGGVLLKWRRGAKLIKIPFITLPDEEEVYV